MSFFLKLAGHAEVGGARLGSTCRNVAWKGSQCIDIIIIYNIHIYTWAKSM